MYHNSINTLPMQESDVCGNIQYTNKYTLAAAESAAERASDRVAVLLSSARLLCALKK